MSFFKELKRRNVVRVGIAYTVATWLLIQVTDIVFPRIGLPDSAVTLVIALLAIGFIPALIFAWAFEMTPEGIKREKEIDRTQSITPKTGKRLDRLTIAGLAVVIIVMGVERIWYAGLDEPAVSSISAEPSLSPTTSTDGELNPAPSDTSDDPSVAVLPFVNMSSDPEQEYFSDGISEEILNVLTRIPNLKVAARTSSFQFKGKNLDIADIGRQLQVNHLLEGSVRKSGNTLRITAQLIETDTGFHLWSESYDRSLEDVFAIQDEIAAAIARQLRTLFADEIGTVSIPVDMEAYEFYLRGRGLVATRRPTEILEGINYLKQALEIEPEYPSAMATLAKAHAVLPYFSTAPARESREQAHELALKALEIDNQNVEALSVLGIVYNELVFDPGKSIELLERAVKLNPGSVVANNFLGDVYLRVADFDKALNYELRAAELDPLGPIQLTDLATLYLIQGDYQNVLSLTERALALDPTFIFALMYQAQAHYFLGNTDHLKRVMQALNILSDIEPGRLATAQNLQDLAEGNRELAELTLKKNVQLANSGNMGFIHVAVHAIQLDEFDIAGQMLLKALQNKDGRWNYPLFIRMPEQAPDSEPWQEFWRQPGPQKVADIRRANGLSPHAPTFGSGAKP